MNPGIVERWRGVQVFLTPVGQMNHRAIAIQVACDLESHLSELLSAFFVSRNPSVSHERALGELYSDGRVLSSLRKMADVALYLGLISDEHRFDLKKLAELRDCYAHVRTLKQLTEEPQLYALVTKTHLYRNNQEQLTGLDQQAVFMCVKEQLIADLKDRLQVFNASSSGTTNVAKDA
jgi:hypothetical protein